MPLRGRWLPWSPRFLAAPGSGVRFPGRSISRVAWRSWRPLLRLPVDHCAGEGAGDAVHGLDAGGYQPAQLIQTGGLDPGDDVVGPVMSSATCTPSRSRSAWAAWATLPTSVRMSTYALSIRADLLAVRSRHPCADRWGA